MVFSGLTAACLRARLPTRRSPDFVKATTEGVVREPSALGMTTGSPPSITAMTELVVPKSIPTVFGMCRFPPGAQLSANLNFYGSVFPPRGGHETGSRLLSVAIFELDPVDRIAVAAVGQPGQRQFFLVASGLGRQLTLTCEGAQIQALIVRLNQMMDSQGIPAARNARARAGPVPGKPEWRVGQSGLGYPEPPRMFVLVASQAAVGEEESTTIDAPSVRFW